MPSGSRSSPTWWGCRRSGPSRSGSPDAVAVRLLGPSDPPVHRPPPGDTGAELVCEVKDAPPAPLPEPRRAGLYLDGAVVDRDGRTYACVDESVSAERALDIATAGAVLVWDPCGCGGPCGLQWFDAAAVATLVASGPPHI